jgi:hypothetical protein
VVGGSANNLIVAMKDGIVIFDAPVDEGQSRWVIDAAKAKFPGKGSAGCTFGVNSAAAIPQRKRVGSVSPRKVACRACRGKIV